MNTAKTTAPVRVEEVNLCPEGIIITFQDKKSAFFDAQYLFDHQDVSGNFPLGEEDFEA